MHKVLILGAGKIGALISGLLAESGDYDVTLADVDAGASAAVVKAHGSRQLRALGLDASDAAIPLNAGLAYIHSPALDAGSENGLDHIDWAEEIAPAVAKAARKGNAHYFDLTEDVEVTRAVRRIARGASKAFVPQCGLAPGFISIAANELTKHFDELRSIKLRVGALPQHPNNVLKYSLTWSTEGLINEYGNPCQAVVDGKIIDAAPLEGLEEIEIDGTLYEAFNTSGGLGSLAESYGKQCEQINYKTMRYPGHCAQMRLLMNDLKLNSDRATLKRVLEHAVPQTLQDVVIVYAAVAVSALLAVDPSALARAPALLAGTALVFSLSIAPANAQKAEPCIAGSWELPGALAHTGLAIKMGIDAAVDEINVGTVGAGIL